MKTRLLIIIISIIAIYFIFGIFFPVILSPTCIVSFIGIELQYCGVLDKESNESELYGCADNEIYDHGICMTLETKERAESIGDIDIGSKLENVPTFDYEIKSDGVTYRNQYQITGGTVGEIIHDAHSNSLIISLNESEKGYITIVIQTGLLHSFDQLPITYFVIVDGEEVIFEQLSPFVLKIPFEKDTREIEIIGTLG